MQDVILKPSGKPLTIYRHDASGELIPAYMYFPKEGVLVPFLDVEIKMKG